LSLVLWLGGEPFLAAVRGGNAMYVGGTVKGVEEKTMGILDVSGEKAAVFKSEKRDATLFEIPFSKVTSLSYGQHAGRRVGSTIAWGVTTLGVAALPILFSKKRRHYLTIEYQDDQGNAQAAILELGKNTIRVSLKTLEVRTGKKVEYEDEEARKAGNK
jgi:hypothetical protein